MALSMGNNSGEAGKCRRNHCKNGKYHHTWLPDQSALSNCEPFCNLTVKIRGPVIFIIAIFAQVYKYNIAL